MKPIHILVGTVYGKALECAEAVKEVLAKAGHEVKIFEQPTLDDVRSADTLLIVTSTTGAGDLPSELETLYFELERDWPNLSDKTYAVFCLGDSSYGDTFCGAGKRMDQIFSELGATRLKPMAMADAMETFEQEKLATSWANELLDNGLSG
jgi:flavodoxin